MAAQVGRDHSGASAERGGDVVPDDRGVAKPVQQQHRGDVRVGRMRVVLDDVQR